MKNQTLTTAQLFQQKADHVKNEICLLLNWTDMDYAQTQYEIGLQYLALYLPSDCRLRKQLECSRLFWNWFKNQWAIHDYELLNDATFLNQPVIDRLGDYKYLHCPKELVLEVKPNNVVLSSIKISA